MTDDEFRSQVEWNLKWREAELRILANQRASLAVPDDPAGPTEAATLGLQTLRRVQIVMLYAHFEGFCKEAFVTYLQAINARQLRRGEVNHVLAATSLSAEFANLHSASRIDLFKDLLPNDDELHTLGRQVAFVRQLNAFDAAVLKVPVDSLDTKSNLEPILLKRLLYRCGCDPEILADARGALARLVRTRHTIAHGEKTPDFDDVRFNEMETAALNAMRTIQRELTRLLAEQAYRRK